MEYNLKETQESFYRERIGKVYGVYEVVAVEYDENKQKQKWTMRCINCGKEKETYNGKDYVKGRNGKTCSCMRKIKPTIEKVNYYSDTYIGNTYGEWRVLSVEPGKGWLCECGDCGRQVWKSARQVFEHKASRCLCKFSYGKYDGLDWVGKRYDHIEIVEPYNKATKTFHCRCDCGYEKDVRAYDLDRGSITSCGRKECFWHGVNSRSAFGMTRSRIYRIWCGMKRRCYDENSAPYKDYGGRGITICDEWRESYLTFAAWAMENGYQDDLSIDRIDVNGNYCPENCRWVTMQEQAKNKRPYSELPAKKRWGEKWEINGETKFASEWCEEYGISYATVQYRIKTKGMTPYEALTTDRLPGGRARKGDKK